MLSDLTDRAAVLAAVGEYDERGEERFLKRYGFRLARRYWLRVGGRTYPSKAIVAAAHGYQFPDRGPLKASEFSGGRDTVAHKLRALGFEVVDVAGVQP